jgi:transcriptional regulator with XRE-family HTH domain
MLDWCQIVGRRVRQLRIAKQYSQERLALEAELDLTYVGGIERGVRNPSVRVLAKLAAVLDVKPSELLEP